MDEDSSPHESERARHMHVRRDDLRYRPSVIRHNLERGGGRRSGRYALVLLVHS